MLTITTSRETPPTYAQHEEISYDLLQHAQLQSTAVNRVAPSNAEMVVDKNDHITP